MLVTWKLRDSPRRLIMNGASPVMLSPSAAPRRRDRETAADQVEERGLAGTVGTMMACRSPSRTSRLTPRMIGVAPKLLCRSSNCSAERLMVRPVGAVLLRAAWKASATRVPHGARRRCRRPAAPGCRPRRAASSPVVDPQHAHRRAFAGLDQKVMAGLDQQYHAGGQHQHRQQRQRVGWQHAPEGAAARSGWCMSSSPASPRGIHHDEDEHQPDVQQPGPV